MADASSQLEAELLAALGASSPGPETVQLQPQPASSESLPSLPIPAAAPASAAPLPAPAPAATSAPDVLPAAESRAKIPSPPLSQLAQSLADAASRQSPGAALVSAPEVAPGSRSPKRALSPDGVDGSNGSTAKRQKVDHTGPVGETGAEAPNLDLAAMLNDALADFDQQGNPGPDDTIMHDAGAAQAAAPRSVASQSDKAENKIMRVSSNPFYGMRSMSLPVLGNIAVQILLRLAQQPRAETESLLANTDSEFRTSYDMLRDMFRATRKAFSDSPLLSPDELDITDSEDRETIRMSNLAATAASVFGSHDVSLEGVHDAAFSIFVPEDAEYKSSLTGFLICLKTRLFLDAIDTPEQFQLAQQLLDALFPGNLDQLWKQRSGDTLLNADEEGLLGEIKERKELLLKSIADEAIKKSLGDQSSSGKLAESLSIFLQAHLGVVVDYAEKYGVNIPLNEDEPVAEPGPNGVQEPEHGNLVALLQSATSHLAQPGDGAARHGKDVVSNGAGPEPPDSVDDDALDLKKLIEESLSSHIPELKESSADGRSSSAVSDFDSKNLASFISEKLKSDIDMSINGLSTLPAPPPAKVHPQYMAQLNQAQSSHYKSYTKNPSPVTPVGPSGEVLPPNQSMPTAALYEKARQAAVAKSSNTTRREGLTSTRRPWTPDEEKALMAGLDTVKGPHWSQILSLYGPNGTISDILKDRTQVQLKDKARNLKLFFLKTNSEMPYYLQSVTGELKTRAPSQAARKEAEEKARLNLEEGHARVQGIMTLAGGLQSNVRPVASIPAAAPPIKRTSPATPGVGAAGVSTTTAPGLGATSTASTRVKTEPSDHPLLPRLAAFPPIQPAPAPVPPGQQAAKPHLQPQPALQQQQPKATAQQQQYHQLQQARQQEPPKLAPSPAQQQRQPLPQQPQPRPQQQQQQPQCKPQPQSQPPPQTQTAQVQTQVPPKPTPPKPQTPSQQPPAQVLQPQPQPQQQHQQEPRPPPNAATANTAANTTASTQTQSQAFPTPPMPPNHHSTPDHAHTRPDAKLFETLQAAIKASTAAAAAAAAAPGPAPTAAMTRTTTAAAAVSGTSSATVKGEVSLQQQQQQQQAPVLGGTGK